MDTGSQSFNKRNPQGRDTSSREANKSASPRMRGSERTTSDMSMGTNTDNDSSSASLSNDEIEAVLGYMEREYGGQLTDEVKRAMRSEIASAVPELSSVLLPLITAAARKEQYSVEMHKQLIKAFMEVMMPHMQKIVDATQR